MLTGLPPFYSKDREKLFKNIKTGNIKYPVYLSNEAVNLLQNLFVRDPDNRLGTGEKGVDGLKAHPFFNSIDWDAIYNKKIKPPFIPKLKSDMETKYIDPEFTNCTPTDSYNPGDSLVDDKFAGFSFNPEPNLKDNPNETDI